MADNATFELRKQLLNNGYFPLPNKGKGCYADGWNRPDFYGPGGAPECFKSWAENTTGVLIRDGLGVIDIDLDDAGLVARAASIVERIAPDVYARAPVRYGGGAHKCAWFVRVEGVLFGHVKSHKYHRKGGEDLHHLEIFGGALTKAGNYSRQFGAFGPYDTTRDYTWAEGGDLSTIPLAELPTLTGAQAKAIVQAFWEEMKDDGAWEQAAEAEHATGADVYDIDRELTVFETRDYGVIKYAELSDLVSAGAEVRMSSTFAGPTATHRLDRCNAWWHPGRQCAVVHDFNGANNHYPADLSPWSGAKELKKVFERAAAAVKEGTFFEAPPRQLTEHDFHAYLPTNQFVFMDTLAHWPGISVNGSVFPVVVGVDEDGLPITIKPTQWLVRNKPLHYMTWAPGEERIIRDRVMGKDGLFDSPGARGLNTYRPPTIVPGDASLAGPWIEHVERVYPEESGHLIKWFAHRRQRPGEKINHSITLGGAPGIGKDTLLEPVFAAVGGENVASITPGRILDKFSPFLRSVILLISEVKDLGGEMTRYEFYERSKILMAAPPTTLEVNEKNKPEYSILNACGVVMTTNYKTNGIYLPADDRRHFVAWSRLKAGDFPPEYWRKLWAWYAAGGMAHVAAYLDALDISDFDPAAPPPKTEAFRDIVGANMVSEDGELADALDALGNPDVVTLDQVKGKACHEFQKWLLDRTSRARVPYRFEQCGYGQVRNPDSAQGLWMVGGRRQVVYGKAEMELRDQLAAVQGMISASRQVR